MRKGRKGHRFRAGQKKSWGGGGKWKEGKVKKIIAETRFVINSG